MVNLPPPVSMDFVVEVAGMVAPDGSLKGRGQSKRLTKIISCMKLKLKDLLDFPMF